MKKTCTAMIVILSEAKNLINNGYQTLHFVQGDSAGLFNSLLGIMAVVAQFIGHAAP